MRVNFVVVELFINLIFYREVHGFLGVSISGIRTFISSNRDSISGFRADISTIVAFISGTDVYQLSSSVKNKFPLISFR
ncbi:hypothetical protein CIL03_05190 [Virgibacillus indicus]|uniref:Uncharacterized protein n=1 Tax=Virgibacillus indicus TaxID=2024554 RepID=A0A265NFD2_9BACI|nr:hypothetical protein CIL03_05190 [Virgibacillus indicus]